MPASLYRRLASTAALIFAPALGQAQERSGEAVYNCTCIVCHGTGLLGAPPFGDARRWSKRVQEGLDDLVPAALHGVGKMPAKGNNPNLSDGEVARAVVYLANAGGGRFNEPTAGEIVRWRALADAKRGPRK